MPLNSPLRTTLLPLAACAVIVSSNLGGDGYVVDAFALLGEKARVDALVVEWLDQLPLQLSDHGGGEAPGWPYS